MPLNAKSRITEVTWTYPLCSWFCESVCNVRPATFWSFTSVHYKSAKQTTMMNLKNQNKNKSISFALSVPWCRCLAPRSCCWRTWRESLRTGRVLLDQSQGLTGFPQDPPRIGPAVLTHCGETHGQLERKFRISLNFLSNCRVTTANLNRYENTQPASRVLLFNYFTETWILTSSRRLIHPRFSPQVLPTQQVAICVEQTV